MKRIYNKSTGKIYKSIKEARNAVYPNISMTAFQKHLRRGDYNNLYFYDDDAIVQSDHETMPTGYEAVLDAIGIQARRDYISLRRQIPRYERLYRIARNKGDRSIYRANADNAIHELKEIENFFSDSWLTDIVDIDSTYFLKALRRAADEAL